MTLADLRREWRHLAGTRIAGLTTPLQVDRGILIVTVPASIFTGQLNEESAAIVDRLGLVDGVEIVGIEWRQVAAKIPPPRRRQSWWARNRDVADD